jgi:hypothetical protein
MQDKNLIPSTVSAVQMSSTIKYQTNGLLFVTNDTDVVPRNESGAIQIEDGITTPTILVVEPMIKRVTTKSVLKVIDTQFTYYKFPARTALDDEPELDLDLDLSLIEEQDIIYARYAPSEDRRVRAGDTYSGILMDEVVDGLLQRKPNRYYISKAIKNSGKDLRLRITIGHRYDSDVNEPGNILFSLIKTSVDQGIIRDWKTYSAPDNGKINQYEVQKLVIDEIIPNSELQIGDTYSIGAYAIASNAVENVILNSSEFKKHTITSATTNWSTTDASKQVDEFNEPTTVIDVPQVTATTTTVPVPVGNYEPFGEAGTVDGETRTFTAGGTLNDIYAWNTSTQSWNKQ